MTNYKYVSNYNMNNELSDNKISPKQLDMKIEINIENEQDLRHPNVFGPPTWFFLHNGSIHYPETPSNIYKHRMKGFIEGLPIMIPCIICKSHLIAYIEKNRYRLDDVVSTRYKLFDFFVELHNEVNERYNKPLIDIKDAYKIYKKKVKVTKITYKH